MSFSNIPLLKIISLLAFASILMARKPFYMIAMPSISITAFFMSSYLSAVIVLLTELPLAYYFLLNYLVEVFISEEGREIDILRKMGTGAYLIFLFSALLSNHFSSCISFEGTTACYIESLIYLLPFPLPGLWYEDQACKESRALEGKDDEDGREFYM